MRQTNSTKPKHGLKCFHLGACCLLITLIANFTGAQTLGPDKVIDSLKGRTSFIGDRIRQGSTFRTAIIFYINDRSPTRPLSSINANQPRATGLVPTTIEVVNASELNGLMIGPPIYPKGLTASSKVSGLDRAAYSGHNKIEFDSRVPGSMPQGEYELRVRLTYQGCGDQGCEAPQSQLVTIPFEIVDRRAKVKWDKYYFPKMTFGDFLLIPVRIAKVGLIPGC